MINSRSAGSGFWVGVTALGGLTLVLSAGLLSNTAIETAFGRAPGSLSWGPLLFRLVLAFHGLLLAATPLVRDSMAGSGAALADVRGRKTSPAIWLALALVCIVALVLRFIGLDSGLWFDEILTLLDWVRTTFGFALTSLPNQNNHILFTVLAKIAVELFGESAWSIRLPAVLFGVGSVWALFMLGRRVIGNREALLASALLAVSYHHIWFSQNARGYSGLLFFSILTTWIWLETLPRGSLRLWIAYAVGVSLGMWVHLTMAFVVASHGLITFVLVLLSLRNRTIKKSGTSPSSGVWLPLAAFLLCVTLTVQLYALALPEFLSFGLHEVSLPSKWVSPIWLVVETVRGLLAGFSGGVLFLGSVILIIGTAVGLIGWISIFRREWHVGMVMVLPGIFIITLMIALGHNLWPRFLFFLAGFALLIGIHGAFVASRLLIGLVTTSPIGEKTAVVAGYTFCLLMIAASLLSLPRYYTYPKQDYEGARDWVETARRRQEPVVTAGLAAVVYTRHYAPEWIGIDSVSELAALRARKETVWFVYSIPVHFASHHPDLLRVLEADFDVVRIFPGTLNGGEIYVYRERVKTQRDADNREFGPDVGSTSATGSSWHEVNSTTGKTG